jgi:hypothetical protein
MTQKENYIKLIFFMTIVGRKQPDGRLPSLKKYYEIFAEGKNHCSSYIVGGGWSRQMEISASEGEQVLNILTLTWKGGGMRGGNWGGGEGGK